MLFIFSSFFSSFSLLSPFLPFSSSLFSYFPISKRFRNTQRHVAMWPRVLRATLQSGHVFCVLVCPRVHVDTVSTRPGCHVSKHVAKEQSGDFCAAGTAVRAVRAVCAGVTGRLFADDIDERCEMMWETFYSATSLKWAIDRSPALPCCQMAPNTSI